MSNLTDALIAAKLVGGSGGSGGSGGGSGLPSTTYYIMRFEPITESAADVLFYRPGEESAAIFATVSVELSDTETGDTLFMGFSDIRPNEEAVPPVSENDILALSLKLACWDKNDESSGAAWKQVMSSSLELYVYPYIL